MAPVELVVKVVGVVRSPQSTDTVQSASEPGSVKEPSPKECASPSSENWLAGGLTVGGTLAMATIWTASESVSLAPSESVTLMATVEELGPSGKLHWKLPPEAVVVGVPTRVPCRPQRG